jgi:hypothetical protein
VITEVNDIQIENFEHYLKTFNKCKNPIEIRFIFLIFICFNYLYIQYIYTLLYYLNLVLLKSKKIEIKYCI